MSTRLDWLERSDQLPFDLDFLRELGFAFGEDWDGEVMITPPDSVNMPQFTALVRRFERGIKTRLYFEGRKALQICVGGPKNGVPYDPGRAVWNSPILYHLKRGSWAVYAIADPSEDPRARFVGYATSKTKARDLWCSAVKGE